MDKSLSADWWVFGALYYFLLKVGLWPEVRISSSISNQGLSNWERQVSGCDFNRSTQHLDSHYREEDVENDVSDADLLH